MDSEDSKDCGTYNNSSNDGTPSNNSINMNSMPDVQATVSANDTDSEATESGEDEMPYSNLNYSEVIKRAKAKVEEIAREVMEREKQMSYILQHDVDPQNRKPGPRKACGPSGEWIERRRC